MDYIFYQVAAVNGFDSFGHYLRAGLIVNQCSTYATEVGIGCSANFAQPATTASAAAATGDPVLDATAAILRGADPDDVVDQATQRANRRAADRAVTGTRQVPMAPKASVPGPRTVDPSTALLDYLFGSEP
jgi:hypothetical protein